MKKLFIWIPAILWSIIIFYLSAIPNLEATSDPTVNFLTRKAAHIVEYGALAIFIYLPTKNFSVSALLSTLYGATDEFHQNFVPTREFHFSDIGFDFLGSLVGVAIFVKIPLSKWKSFQTQAKIQKR